MGSMHNNDIHTLKRKNLLLRDQELELAQRVKDGDNDAWGKLYGHFFMAAKGYIAGKIGDIVTAEDLTQECFIRAQKLLTECKYDPNYRFYTFLRSIVIKEVLNDYWKKNYLRIPETGEKGAERSKKSIKTAFSDNTDALQQLPKKKSTYIPKETPISQFVKPDAEDTADDYIRDKLLNDPENQPDPVNATIRLQLLELIFLCCAKPHHILACSFIKLLQWKPNEVAKEFSSWSLEALADKFCKEYYSCAAYELDYNYFCSSYCSYLMDKLEKFLQDVYIEAEYENLKKVHSGLNVKTMLLKDFYRGRDPESSLSDWCDKVKKRAKNLVNEGVCLCES